MRSPIDRETFLQELEYRFPAIAEDIGEIESGLLHPEMAVVAGATRKAIEARDWPEVERHFAFVAELFVCANEALANAIYVSYLENVLFGEIAAEYRHARTLLPPSLTKAMAELEEHFENLAHAQRGA